MMYVLTITVLPNTIHNIPFLRIITDFRWIYAVSRNEPLLLNFRNKIESFTPAEYLQYLRIEVSPYDNLTRDEIESNFNPRENGNARQYELDKFYIEGVVNCDSSIRNMRYSYDEFLPEHWNCFNEIELEN